MPDTAGANTAQGGANAAAQQKKNDDPSWLNIFGQIVRGFVLWYLLQTVVFGKKFNFFGTQPDPVPASAVTTTPTDIPTVSVNEAGETILPQVLGTTDAAQAVKPKKKHTNLTPLWKYGAPINLYVFLANEAYPMGPSSHLVWEESNVYFGDLKDDRKFDLTIPIGDLAKRNASVYAHIFLTYGGSSYDPLAPNYHPDSVMKITKPLLRFGPKKKEVKLKKLIGDAGSEQPEVEEEPEQDEEPTAYVPYYWPNMTVALVPSDMRIPVRQPPGVIEHLRVASFDDSLHLPFFIVNDFWLLQENLIWINETVTTMNVSCRFHQLPLWQFQLYMQFDESFRMQNTMMGVSAHETDQVKRMLLETNPWLLGITMIVSILHSVFDFLAFKNDIQFWRNKKDFEGLSFRSTMLNIFFQVVIFLYLVDNDTSWMILISNGIGLLIEIWKINKAVIVKRKPTFPFVEFEDRVKPSKKISKTREYDELAFKYLSYALYPLMAAYSVYSLMYQEHKGWYSFILNTIVGFVYAFGFITMTPQLFINYKLKSVAHMPWKTFMYKALNTFIDDLFAFVIKMPTLHRLATLRDDVIFLIYLYQRWIYPEDHKRRNEFGQVGKDGAEDEEEEEKKDEGVDGPAKEAEGTSTAVEGSKTSAVQRKKN